MTGNPSEMVMNPYSSSTYRLKPVTWEEFYLKIPKNLFLSLVGTVFVFTIVILGDKKNEKTDEIKNQN
jgi:hypothetical protein